MNAINRCFKQSLFLGIGAIVFIFGTAGCSDFSAPGASGKSNASIAASVTISSVQLFREYEQNEIAADQKYKGKVLAVQGVVDGIGKDLIGQMYVTLEGGEYFGSIQCMLTESSANTAAKLTKGQQLSVKGMCDGKLGNVLLAGCVIE